MGLDIGPYGQAIASTTDFLSGLMKRVFPEKMSELDAAKLNQEITMALINGQIQPMLAQLEINKVEAASDNWFVAGWRPAVGWVCVAALGWQFVGLQIAQFGVALFKLDVGTLPVFNYAELSPILLGMLGLGIMRSYEKIKGETTTATKVGA